MILVDWFILLANPCTTAAILMTIIKRRYLLPGIIWLTRLALAILGAGLMVTWLMTYYKTTGTPPPVNHALWFLKDAGVFLLFLSVVLVFNVGRYRHTHST